jgi:hypothetical protein
MPNLGWLWTFPDLIVTLVIVAVSLLFSIDSTLTGILEELRLRGALARAVREVRASAARSAKRLWAEVGDAVGEPECPFVMTWAAVESRGGDGRGARRGPARSAPLCHQG